MYDTLVNQKNEPKELPIRQDAVILFPKVNNGNDNKNLFTES